jgi:hypothetical protein
VRWYDATRHTFATSLLCGLWRAPWRIEDVSTALGHSSIALTQRHYARVIPSALHGRAQDAERDFARDVDDVEPIDTKVAGRSLRDTGAEHNARLFALLRRERDTGSETRIHQGRSITRDAAFFCRFSRTRASTRRDAI